MKASARKQACKLLREMKKDEKMAPPAYSKLNKAVKKAGIKTGGAFTGNASDERRHYKIVDRFFKRLKC